MRNVPLYRGQLEELVMRLDHFIAMLQQHKDEHGNETDIDFWDAKNERPLKLVDQSADEPGIEISRYNCGCAAGVTINLEPAEGS